MHISNTQKYYQERIGITHQITYHHYMKQISKNKPMEYHGNDKTLLAFILGLLGFWLFAMTLLNVQNEMNNDLKIPVSSLNLAISITSLISGIFIVVLGGFADKFGRVLIVKIGLVLGCLGSLAVALTPSESMLSVPVLLLGRVLQGFSGACIMPASLALLNVYWDERGRQRAVSLWSMGTWGGTSFAPLLGGFISSHFGWRYIFFVGALFCAIGFFLMTGVPESKNQKSDSKRFDLFGFITFIVSVVFLLIYVSYAPVWGWGATKSLMALGVALFFFIVFFFLEYHKDAPFIDFRLFKNMTFTGATISNFCLNATAGVIIISLALIQHAGNVSSDFSGYLTVGYGVTILLFMRLGEYFLRRYGARTPMLWGTLILVVSVLLLTQTQIMFDTYTILMVVAYILFGTGLAFYATPSTDAALSNLPLDQSGVGSGIYKMASSLGASFGLALSNSVYTMIYIGGEPIPILSDFVAFIGRQDNVYIRHAGMMAMLFNLAILFVTIGVILITVPKKKKAIK